MQTSFPDVIEAVPKIRLKCFRPLGPQLISWFNLGTIGDYKGFQWAPGPFSGAEITFCSPQLVCQGQSSGVDSCSLPTASM
eukprot:2179217-Pyramimonas_sp.AAC.1